MENEIIFHLSFVIGNSGRMVHSKNEKFQMKNGIWKISGNIDDRQKKLGASQAMADILEDRLINFAVRIIKLSAALPKTPAGKHIAGQILRSGTSPAPNYGEARGAESHADFVTNWELC